MTNELKKLVKKQADKIELLERQLHYCRRVSKLTEDECARIIGRQNDQLAKLKDEVKQYKFAISRWKKEEKAWHKKEVMKPTVFELVGINMVGAGGPMGSQDTPEIFRRLFHDRETAQRAAELHYQKESGEKKSIKFAKRYGVWSSGDLSWIMYEIRPSRVV